ncbi:hypothetical protein KBA73_03120 [Patescibacteria group bacterium]|nr:hypothetical protein [Patescibacteria group bacterium]
MFFRSLSQGEDLMAEIVTPGYKDPKWNEVVPCLGNAVTKRPDAGCGAMIRITNKDFHTLVDENYSGDFAFAPIHVVYRCPCGSATVHPQSRSLRFLNPPNKGAWEEIQRRGESTLSLHFSG